MTEFTKQEAVDTPGIIGARWWQQSIATQVPRRQAMTGLLALGGVLGAMAAIGTCVAVSRPKTPGSPGIFSSTPEVDFQPRAALDMQKEYGWNFGATGEALTFDGTSTQAFNPASLATMVDDFAPSVARYKPFFIPTLFQSPTALQKTKPTGDPDAAPFAPLKDSLKPMVTPGMITAFGQGAALTALFDKEPRAQGITVVVDLPGPEAVAFAAGASGVLDPIYLFDNWPHPRGVVPAHLTLAAAAYYQPMCTKARATRPATARPLFVLDRKRLAPYADDASQFDNRHVAKMPGAALLATLGTKHVLYIGPNAIDREPLDDLVDDFLAYAAAKIALHLCPATAFEDDLTDAIDTSYYGGSKAKQPTFWTHWVATSTTSSTNEAQAYVPVARKTQFSSGTPTSPVGVDSRPRPMGFGTVPVAIAVGTGIVLGARASRSGSWNRTSSTSSSS